MIEMKSRWKRVMGREKWAARGASLVAKTKATKVVWFPPKPVETGKKAAATAETATKKTTKKTAGAAKKTTTGAAKKSAGAAKKTTNSTKKATKPAAQKKT